MEMPIEPSKEAQRAPDLLDRLKKRKGVEIRVVSKIEFTVPYYRKLPDEEKRRDIETIKGIERLCSQVPRESFTDKEGEFEPIFEIFKKISGKGPKIEFDIVSDNGWNYPFLRLYDWDGLYYAPYLLVKNSKLTISTLAHEEGHRKDKFYSKWDYAFDWSRRCRMEAVAIAHQHLVADYFASVYKLDGISRKIWLRTKLSEAKIYYLRIFKTFKEFYDDDHDLLEKKGIKNGLEYLTGRTMYHILLYKFKGSPKQTFEFLKSHDDKDVFEAIYEVLKKKNYIDAIDESIKMTYARLRFGRFFDIMPFTIGSSYWNKKNRDKKK